MPGVFEVRGGNCNMIPYKYYPLELFLSTSLESEITLTFEEIETIIEANLPPSAFKHLQWWYTHPESQTKSWTNANFQAKVDLENRKIYFTKESRLSINSLDKNKIIENMIKKLETVGFVFEKEQPSHMQNRNFNELKFTNTILMEKFLKDGFSTRAKKFYIKALGNSSDFEIGFVTGNSSPLVNNDIFYKPNTFDSFDNNPAWTNRENDSSFDKLIASIQNYLNNETLVNYWTFFCNPKYWDIKNFLIDLNNGTQSEIDSWRISDHHKDLIKEGDYGVIRVGIDKRTKAELNGDEKVYPGVYAIVKVVKKPYFEEMIDDSNYWNDSEPVSKRKYKVKIEFIKNFIDKPILFEKYGELLSEDKYLVKGFQASSMPLLPDVFQKIRELKNIEIENLNDKDFLDTVSTNLEQIYHDLKNTERETIVKTRIGQNLFKNKLLKQSCKCNIYDCFDMFCGTSTGGIIALGLANQNSVTQIIEFYEKNGEKIFPSKYRLLASFKSLFLSSKYENKELKRCLTEVFKDSAVKDLNKKVCIPTVCLDEFKPVLIKTSHCKEHTRDASRKLVDVALATSAAPTFFPIVAVDEKLKNAVDGGVYANNPSLIGLIESLKHFVGENNEFNQIDMLSIGNVENKAKWRFLLDKDKKNKSLLNWRDKLIELFMSTQSKHTEFLMNFISTLTDFRLKNYIRISNSSSHQNIKLDKSSEKVIEELKRLAQNDFDNLSLNDKNKLEAMIKR